MVKRYIYGGKTYTLNSLRQEFRKRDLAITDYYNNLEVVDYYQNLNLKNMNQIKKK